MCDEDTQADNERVLAHGWTRRRFGIVSAASALSFTLPAVADAQPVMDADVRITTPDGEADAYFVHPSAGRHPGVLIWPDIVGLRPAFKAMAKRLAQSGYAVLVVNPYYREVPAPVVPPGASFRDPKTRDVLLPLARSLSVQTNVTDANAFVAYLDKQPSVDTERMIGTMGYCMGGPMTFRTAGAEPGRIGAVASFHGGRLVVEGDASPHRLIPSTNAGYLIAIAENDDEKEPETKNVLRQAFSDAGREAEIEVYKGALHGWCPPDSQVYNEVAAERAWQRLLVLFEQNLGARA